MPYAHNATVESTPHPDEPPTPASAPTRARAAIAGMLAVVSALAAAELCAGLIGGARSLVIAVGDTVIDLVPGWLERAAISLLGTADKPVLLFTIVTLTVIIGAVFGRLAARRFAAGAAGIVVLAVIGAVAELRDPRAELSSVLFVALAFALAGIGVLKLLLRAAAPRTSDDRAQTMDAVSRRRFLQQTVAVAAAAGLAGFYGSIRTGRSRIEQIRAAIRLPRPARAAPAVPAGATVGVPGVARLFTPNAEFFRIDTALSVPRVDPADWSLTVGGRVNRPFRLSYADLMALPHVEADITLACVSNEVGGELVGNARWQGVPLASLLERAGVRDGVTQVVGRSVDGFTAGFPIESAGGETLVAVAMNGEPLPVIHGFPARLVVPGLYGYVSATKWLSSIELTTWEETVGYWVPRGWSARGPIKTQSRIDVPRTGTELSPGRRAIAGVAWAPTRGIGAVEVRIDDGPWTAARLAAPVDEDVWRQWVYVWDANPGDHLITVRATDGSGEVQTAMRASVAPDGASGHHSIAVSVGDA